MKQLIASPCDNASCPLYEVSDTHPIIVGFIRQLLSPDIIQQIAAIPPERLIDVTLYASSGRAVLGPDITSRVKSG